MEEKWSTNARSGTHTPYLRSECKLVPAQGVSVALRFAVRAKVRHNLAHGGGAGGT